MTITKEQFIEYEQVRQSGVTNMFNITLICELTSLTKANCFEIMKTYGDLDKQYPEVTKTNYQNKIGLVNFNNFK